jgi:hypothetical protein
LWLAFCRAVSRRGRVALSGVDGDTLFNEMTTAHFAHLVRTGRVGDLLIEMVRYATWLGRCPPIALRTTLRRVIGRGRDDAPPFPRWIAPEFSRELDLQNRWREVWSRERASQRSLRPRATWTMRVWPRAFEGFDAGLTGHPLEFRWPLADPRLVDYALAIPAVPWCTAKTLLREAARGVLPEAVRRRKKTPLAGNLRVIAQRRPESAWLDAFEPVPALARFVDRRAVPRVTGPDVGSDIDVNLRPIMLNWWLEYSWPRRGSWRGVAHGEGSRDVRHGTASQGGEGEEALQQAVGARVRQHS